MCVISVFCDLCLYVLCCVVLCCVVLCFCFLVLCCVVCSLPLSDDPALDRAQLPHFSALLQAANLRLSHELSAAASSAASASASASASSASASASASASIDSKSLPAPAPAPVPAPASEGESDLKRSGEEGGRRGEVPVSPSPSAAGEGAGAGAGGREVVAASAAECVEAVRQALVSGAVSSGLQAYESAARTSVQRLSQWNGAPPLHDPTRLPFWCVCWSVLCCAVV